MVLGLLLLLVILRFDAERFNAAEYDDIDRWGRTPSLLRRLAWYILGIGGILARAQIHPDPAERALPGPRRPPRGGHPRPRLRGDRGGDRRGHRARTATTTSGSRRPACIPAQDHSTRSRRRSSTRRSSAGSCSASCSPRGMDPERWRTSSRRIMYALATRLGAPGRPWYMLVTSLVIGLAGGWLTGITGRHRRRVPGPRDHPHRDLPHDRPRGHPEGARHRGRGGRAAAADAGGLAGPGLGRDAGALTASTRDAPAHRPCRSASACDATAAPGRALRPRPVLRLALPVLRLRRVRGGGGARPGRAGGCVHRGAARGDRRCAPTRLDAAFGRERAPLRSVYLGGGTPTLLPAAVAGAILDLVRSRFGIADGAEVTIESNPGPDERGDLGRPGAPPA